MNVITDTMGIILELFERNREARSEDACAVHDVMAGGNVMVSAYRLGSDRIFIDHRELGEEDPDQELLVLLTSLKSIRTLDTLRKVMKLEEGKLIYTPIKKKYSMLNDHTHGVECTLTRVNDILVYNDDHYHDLVVHGGVSTGLYVRDNLRHLSLTEFSVGPVTQSDTEILITDRVSNRSHVEEAFSTVSDGMDFKLLPGLSLISTVDEVILSVTDGSYGPCDHGQVLGIMREYSIAAARVLMRATGVRQQPVTIN